MITLTVNDRVGTLMLDRPPVNAWDDAALDSFESALANLQSRDDVDLVVVRSAGRHFSAGGDVKMMAAAVEVGDIARLDRFAARIQSLFTTWERLEVPTVAVIHGAATGGGLELALACDLRIAVANSQLGLPEGRLGLVAAGGGTQRITRAVGRGRAMRLMLTGELIDGAAAERIGLVEWCVGADRFEDECRQIIADLLANAGPAQRAVKACVAMAGTAEGYAIETISQRQLHTNPDTQGRLRDFVITRRNS